jgi:L-seryl-tRNA(Ser) seleniumtransferase
VIVSRGELVEIGGSFRVPDVMARAGVRLVEVGTTNRTHPADVEGAIGPATAALLKVHRSNFEQRGFVAEVPLEALAGIGRRHGLPVVDDLGSGTVVDLRGRGLPAESFAPARLGAGADVVCFSGDKLLGGPQAGIVLGRAGAIAAMRRSPLARALRLDKLGLAALDATLRLLAEGRDAEIPTLRMLREPVETLEARAQALARRLAKARGEGGGDGLALDVVRTVAPAGGGSIPGFELAGAAVALRAPGGAEVLARRLRAADVPVVARVAEGRVLLETRTLCAGDEALVEDALRAALAAAARD